MFGWKIVKVPMEGRDYWIIQTIPTDEQDMTERPGVNGGRVSKEYLEKGCTQLNDIVVENIDEYAAKVTAIGVKLLATKVHVPTVGYTAIPKTPKETNSDSYNPTCPNSLTPSYFRK